MQYNSLGNSDLLVSRICLGTMTWGEQNSEADAQAQLDYALSQGINFIDTAEIYPVPPKPETYSYTETFIGRWLKQQQRDKIILATKVAGPGDIANHVRGGPRLNRQHIRQAIDGSLKRLNTDYVDLYQLHWPERQANFFGKLGYTPAEDTETVPLLESLEALGELVKEGKVRYIGLSNETPWGVMRFLQLAAEYHLLRVISVQNPYNLLNRTYEIGLAEITHRENVGLMVYSPLAFGVLSGKYLYGARPAGARLTLFTRFDRYTKSEQGNSATQAYVELARQYGLKPAQMALAFVNSQPFVHSNIISATTLEQLADNIATIDLTLSEEVLNGIAAIYQLYPNPCP